MFNINFGKSLSVFLNLLLVFSLLAVSKIPPAFACDSNRPGSPTEELAKSTAVFSGKVLSVSRDGYTDKVKFNVDKIWKGVSEKNVVVSTTTEGAMCGFGFKENEKYIVYAYGEISLGTGLCSRTHLLTLNDPDISVLGIGKSPTLGIEPTPKDAPISYMFMTSLVGISIVVLVVIGITYRIISSRKKLT